MINVNNDIITISHSLAAAPEGMKSFCWRKLEVFVSAHALELCGNFLMNSSSFSFPMVISTPFMNFGPNFSKTSFHTCIQGYLTPEYPLQNSHGNRAILSAKKIHLNSAEIDLPSSFQKFLGRIITPYPQSILFQHVCLTCSLTCLWLNGYEQDCEN